MDASPKDENCPICSAETPFDKILHHNMYLIGYLSLMPLDKDSPMHNFYLGIRSSTKRYLESRNKEINVS